MAYQGLIYFNRTEGYSGDTTSLSGKLTPDEIDTNFFNLRGTDIMNISYDSENHELALEAFDCDQDKSVTLPFADYATNARVSSEVITLEEAISASTIECKAYTDASLSGLSGVVYDEMTLFKTQISGQVIYISAATKEALEDMQETIECFDEQKQDKLVCGTNIQTINGHCILSAGNYDIIDDSIISASTTWSSKQINEKLSKTLTAGKNIIIDENNKINAVGYEFNTALSSITLNPIDSEVTLALGNYSHAEGWSVASGMMSYSFGHQTMALGDFSHAEGEGVYAIGENSFAIGEGTVASGDTQLVIGKRNIPDKTSAFIIGNGETNSNSLESNAFTVDWSGNTWMQGSLTLSSTQLTESVLKDLLAPHNKEAEQVVSKVSKDFKFVESTPPTSSETYNIVVITGVSEDTAYEYSSSTGTWELTTLSAEYTYFEVEESVLYLYNSSKHKLAPIELNNTFIVNGDIAKSAAVSALTTQGTYTIIQHAKDKNKNSYVKNWTLEVYYVQADNEGEEEVSITPSLYQEIKWYNNVQRRKFDFTNQKWGSFVSYYVGYVYDKTTTKKDSTFSQEKIMSLLDEKQNVLSAGTGIKIENNVISATGGTSYSAGDNIQISSNTISALGYSYNKNINAYSEGSNCVARGEDSHVEGGQSDARGTCSHAEGHQCVTFSQSSHAEGHSTSTSGRTQGCDYGAHAEGYVCKAYGNWGSHAEGYYTEAYGNNSHAEGCGTIANGNSQHVQGKYNVPDITSAFIIGNGESSAHTSNALTVDWNGVIDAASAVTVGSAIKIGNTILNEAQLQALLRLI